MSVRVSMLAAAIAVLSLGCHKQPTPAAGPGDYFVPAYYNDHVVYFDPYGLPYYLAEGRQVFIDRHDQAFIALVEFYHENPRAYRRWEKRMNNPDLTR